MLVGILRVSGGVFAEMFTGTGTDMPKLRAMLGDRLLPDWDPLLGQKLPRDAIVDARRRDEVRPLHLLSGILVQESGPCAKILAGVGTNVARLLERSKGVA